MVKEMAKENSETSVTACVLIIGNEILSGRTQDTNLNHIALTLGGWGIQVRHARVIPDVPNIIVDTLNEVRTQYDYVLTTGGIGPTHDDITADCVAAAFAVPIIEHPDIAAIIHRRPAPSDVMDSRMRMARVPQGATLIDNPTGGPQGFRIENVLVMAGIPRVMQAMLSTLESTLHHGAVVRSGSVTAYLGESQIATGLGEVQARYPDVDIGSYPFLREDRYGTSLVVRGTNASEINAVLDEICDLIAAGGERPEELQRA